MATTRIWPNRINKTSDGYWIIYFYAYQSLKYNIYVDSVLRYENYNVDEDNDTSIEIYGEYDYEEPPVIEIYQCLKTDDFDYLSYYDYMPESWSIQFSGIPNAYSYIIDVKEDGESTYTYETRISETGQPYYKYQSQIVYDKYSATVRVTAEDIDGNDIDYSYFKIYILSFPRPPSIETTYDDTSHVITFLERV